MQNWVFLNDSLVAAAEARLRYDDLSFQRGYGVFDFFRLQGQTPLFLEDHLDRFYHSAQGLHLQAPERSFLKGAIAALISKNNRPNTGVRLALSGGSASEDQPFSRPQLVISQEALSSPTPDQERHGIRLRTYPHQRTLPQFKSIDYLMAVWLQPWCREQGVDDVLYHHNGWITECPRSNFFLITQDNHLVTAADNVLLGVTRGKLLTLAQKGWVVEERPVHMDEIPSAKAAFVTSTSKQLLPVRQIDDTELPHMTPVGALLHEFRRAYLG